MSEQILYKAEHSFRIVGIILLLVLSTIWFYISGYDLIVNHEPFTIDSTIITGIFCFLGLCSLILIFVGGQDYLEINEDSILWKMVLWNFVLQERQIHHNEVEYFESTIPSGSEDEETRVFLKNGESVRIPEIGNKFKRYTTLLGIWRYQETNQNKLYL